MVFIYVMIAVLVLLSINEIARYRSAGRGGDELPYPRRRLVRRLVIAALFVGVLVAVGFWPQMRPLYRLYYMTAILLVSFSGLLLIWLELAETSRAAIRQAQAMNIEAAKNLERMLREKRSKKMNEDPTDPTDQP